MIEYWEAILPESKEDIMDVRSELLKVTKVTQSEGENEQAFLTKVFNKANKLSDADWDKLSEPTQNWINDAGDAVAAGKAIAALPNGADTAASAEPAAKETVEEKNVEEKATKKATKKAAKKEAKSKKEAKPVKAASKTPAKSKAKVKAKAEPGRVGRKGSFPLTAKIKLTEKENPHRPGTKLYKMYQQYKNNMTVQQALDAGAVWSNIRYLVGRKLLEIS